MKRILSGNKDLALDTIKKLMKTDMNLAKECGVQLIASLLPQLEGSEPVLMELYGGLVSNDNMQLKIIAAKYLQVNPQTFRMCCATSRERNSVEKYWKISTAKATTSPRSTP